MLSSSSYDTQEETQSFADINYRITIATLCTFITRAHRQTQTTGTETDPYELFAVGELLGPGCGFTRVYIEDRPTS